MAVPAGQKSRGEHLGLFSCQCIRRLAFFLLGGLSRVVRSEPCGGRIHSLLLTWRSRLETLYTGTVNFDCCGSPQHLNRENEPGRISFADQNAFDSGKWPICYPYTVSLSQVHMRFERIRT